MPAYKTRWPLAPVDWVVCCSSISTAFLLQLALSLGLPPLLHPVRQPPTSIHPALFVLLHMHLTCLRYCSQVASSPNRHLLCSRAFELQHAH